VDPEKIDFFFRFYETIEKQAFYIKGNWLFSFLMIEAGRNND